MKEFVDCFEGNVVLKQTHYNFKEALHSYCKNYGSVSSMYDFHLFLDAEGTPLVENARFHLSETYLCGSRQEATAFVSPVFRVTFSVSINKHQIHFLEASTT